MTEAQIERRAERMMDHLDHLFMAGEMSKAAYEKAMRDLDVWVTLKLATRPKHDPNYDTTHERDMDLWTHWPAAED